MIATIVSALISACASILVCALTINANHRKLTAELKERDILQQYRIEQLEKKQDKHNNLMERTYRLEEKIKVANHRIDDLEKEKKGA